MVFACKIYYPHYELDKPHKRNMRSLCQGREDNPAHTDAFNELIENLKEKNPTWNRTTFKYERSVTRTSFMEKNSDDGDR